MNEWKWAIFITELKIKQKNTYFKHLLSFLRFGAQWPFYGDDGALAFGNLLNPIQMRIQIQSYDTYGIEM